MKWLDQLSNLWSGADTVVKEYQTTLKNLFAAKLELRKLKVGELSNKDVVECFRDALDEVVEVLNERLENWPEEQTPPSTVPDVPPAPPTPPEAPSEPSPASLTDETGQARLFTEDQEGEKSEGG